ITCLFDDLTTTRMCVVLAWLDEPSRHVPHQAALIVANLLHDSDVHLSIKDHEGHGDSATATYFMKGPTIVAVRRQPIGERAEAGVLNLQMADVLDRQPVERYCPPTLALVGDWSD